MQSFTFDNTTSGLAYLCRQLTSEGVRLPSARGDMYELEDVTIRVSSTRSQPHLRPGTSPKAIGMLEGAGMIAGISTAEAMRSIAPRIDEFTDFYGEYGPRISWQMPALIQKLTNEPDTRQAVITMWSPTKDLPGGRRDHPCTIGVTFRIRGNLLNMTVHMRSNDVYLGWSNDVVQFSLLHLTMCSILGLLPGTYVHHSDSMHLYSKNFDMAKDLALNFLGSQELDKAKRMHNVNPLMPLLDPLDFPGLVTERHALMRYELAVIEARRLIASHITL